MGILICTMSTPKSAWLEHQLIDDEKLHEMSEYAFWYLIADKVAVYYDIIFRLVKQWFGGNMYCWLVCRNIRRQAKNDQSRSHVEGI